MGASRKYPLEFRKEDVSYVMQRWRAADSCALVGVGSVGKSNLLQHLADPDVQTQYMKHTNSSEFKAIIVDPNMLGPLPDSGPNADQFRCWAGYELMMHRLFMALFPFDSLPREDAESFYSMYQTLQDGSNPLFAYMGLRYFELGLGYVMRAGIRIVFMFDEFEELLKQLPVKFFHTLRGLRDANKKQLSYLTFTRKPIDTVIKELGIDPLEIEPFMELFTDNVHFVGPYNETDARQMVYNLMDRNQHSYQENVVDMLLQATGRFAGLIRSAYRALETLNSGDLNGASVEGFSVQLASRPTIRVECRTIWNSLSEAERHLLRAVANLAPYEPNTIAEPAVTALVQKRLLRIDKLSNRLTIEPPVFRIFVTNNPDASSA